MTSSELLDDIVTNILNAWRGEAGGALTSLSFGEVATFVCHIHMEGRRGHCVPCFCCTTVTLPSGEFIEFKFM